MAVILSNVQLAVRTRNEHPWERDAYGVPVAPVESEQPVASPLRYNDGYAKERRGEGDAGIEWQLRVDPSDWPLEKGDQLTDGTRVWAIDSAVLHESASGFDDVDYIEVLGRLETPKVL